MTCPTPIEIDLEKLVNFSQYVVVVELDTPANSKEEIQIHADTERYPSFTLHKEHYILKEILYAEKKNQRAHRGGIRFPYQPLPRLK